MGFTLNLHPASFGARKGSGYVTVDVIATGGGSEAYIFLNSRAQCDELIRAAFAARDMLSGETSEPVPVSAEDDAGRAIAADVDSRTARVWAVFEVTRDPGREDTEVAGPFTHREADIWATVNSPMFAGPLYIGRARTDMDERPAPLPPFHASGTGHPSCGAKDSDGYVCTAQRGHAGPVHVAFNPEPGGGIYRTWTDAE